MYPDAQNGEGWTGGKTNELYTDWIQKEDIRIAEYFYVDTKKDRLVLLSDGTVLWEDQVKMIQGAMAQAGIEVTAERTSWRRTVKWCKQTALDILEERDLPGRWIPIVPVYGE